MGSGDRELGEAGSGAGRHLRVGSGGVRLGEAGAGGGERLAAIHYPPFKQA